jgi:hypothetical protein
MKLYNVEVNASYEASYEGEINKDYTRLVFANSEDEAINFVNDNLKDFNNNYNTEVAKTAYEIDFNKVTRKRKVGYYLK